MQLPSVQRTKHQGIRLPIPAVRAAPPDGGGSLLVSRFLPTRELSNNRITLHRTTSAKTRATAMLRQHAHTAERYSQCQHKSDTTKFAIR